MHVVPVAEPLAVENVITISPPSLVLSCTDTISETSVSFSFTSTAVLSNPNTTPD